MARKKKRGEEQQRALTPKEIRVNARRRDRDRRYWTIIGSVLAVAALIVIAGILNEFVIKPNSTLASVGDQPIVTRDFWQQVRLDHNRLQNQLLQLRQFEQQFGAQPFLSAQINEVQATLSSPFALGLFTLDRMIEQIIIRREAAARGIVVTEAEIDELLREEIAATQGAVTEPQATATAEAAVEATAVAATWTPTPVPTSVPAADATDVMTPTGSDIELEAESEIELGTELPDTDVDLDLDLEDLAGELDMDPEDPPTAPLLTDELYQQGLEELADNLRAGSGLTIEDYRELLRDRLLAERLEEMIAADEVEPTEVQVNARHILLNIRESDDEPDLEFDDLFGEEDGEVDEFGIDDLFQEDEEEIPDVAPTPQPRNEDETLALAQELQARILAGEDFEMLAMEYSDDAGSAVIGGDLDWFGRGRMVPEFEDAAFALEEGEVSDPVRTDFGYHIIQVVERDESRPKDEATLQQERQEIFDAWLRSKVAEANVQRPTDLASRMPRDLRSISPVLPQAMPFQQ